MPPTAASSSLTRAPAFDRRQRHLQLFQSPAAGRRSRSRSCGPTTRRRRRRRQISSTISTSGRRSRRRPTAATVRRRLVGRRRPRGPHEQRRERLRLVAGRGHMDRHRRGYNVPKGPQPYAVVVGGLASPGPPVEHELTVTPPVNGIVSSCRRLHQLRDRRRRLAVTCTPQAPRSTWAPRPTRDSRSRAGRATASEPGPRATSR